MSNTLTYATVADFRAYSPLLDYLSDDTVNQKLFEAEFDVDSLFANREGIIAAHGRRWDPSSRDSTTLDQAKALERATCAQAEYRQQLGDQAFAVPGLEIDGPDFTIKGGRVARYASKMLWELKYANMLITGTRAVA